MCSRRAQHALVIVLVTCLQSVAAAQQERDTDGMSDEPDPRPRSGSLLADVAVSGVFDSNIDHDERDVTSYGTMTATRLQIRNAAAGLEYRLGLDRFSQTERWDRLTHRLTGRAARRLSSDWTFNVLGQLALGHSSDDREMGNLYTLTPRVDYRIARGRRARWYGTYRWKQLLERPENSERTLYVGGDYRQDVGDRQRWIAGYRYEVNQGLRPTLRYARHTYSAEYLLDVTRRSGLRLDTTLGLQDYPERFVALDIGAVLRRDVRWTSEVTWLTRLSGAVTGEIIYEFSARTSNEPDKAYRAHRVAYTVAWQGGR